MQFHWIAPLALIPFVMRQKPIGFIVATLMTLLGIASILAILLHYPDMSLNTIEAFIPQPGPTFFKYIYIKPWTRAPATADAMDHERTGNLVDNDGNAFLMVVASDRHRTINFGGE
ncbi:unnamed protein product [Rotaria sordida]|uniref:Uncharacterized protein n=1 Tax=Rotaria sordida TaxID=392033 RepID=A0A814UA90_9BILA|nr:unnamed protein product [Rotaria sordida]